MPVKAKAKTKTKQTPRSIRRRQRRVFILGAGASASCGIAVARDILREGMQRLAKRDAKQAKKVHDLLHYLYPGFDEELSNYPNVEDFMNFEPRSDNDY